MRILMVLFLCLLTVAPEVLAAPVILFDEGHGQPFLVGGSGPLDLSALAETLTVAGYEVRPSAQPLDNGQLEGVDALVISGAFKPLMAAELTAVEVFLANGGGLAVMLHIAPPMAGLLDLLQVDFANGILNDMNNVIDNNPQNFRVRELAKHPLTDGLEEFSVYGTWALRSLGPSAVMVGHASERGWVDLNHDGQLSPGDALGAFGLMAAGNSGQGRFVVIGDDALFQNRFLDTHNRFLADHLARWLCLNKPAGQLEQKLQ
jgi:hypothetical protein